MKFHPGYGMAAIGYMTGIFMLSSLPGAKSGPAVQLLTNFLHVPLYFGLAVLLLLSVTGGQWYRTIPCQLYWSIGLLAGTYAAFDEWHQSFVVGRFAGASDFLLDCLGVAGLLLIHRWLTRHRATA